MELEMEMETGNDRRYMKMVVRQSIVLHGAWRRELTWKLCLHFDSLVLRLPYLFFGYYAGSWNNDNSDLTSVITGGPPAINVQNHDGPADILSWSCFETAPEYKASYL